jgi:hypothetical protein
MSRAAYRWDERHNAGVLFVKTLDAPFSGG